MRLATLALAAGVLAAAALAFLPGSRAGELNQQIPAPAQDAPTAAASETAVLAGGCFWGQQGVFAHVKGVTKVVAGYSGGARETANYDAVSSESTGHAESVQITFDPRQISYGTLLRIFFSVAHDPTEVNRQGPDQGPSYRTAIFPTSPAQAETARAYIAQLDKAKVFPAPIATRVEAYKGFFPAEEEHQDYLFRHPDSAYIQANDLPKIEALKRVWPQYYRSDAVRLASR